jgi:hypothetical protein
MDNKLFDLYTDYLIVSTGLATSVGLSNILNKEISHDKITRFLSEKEFTSKELWKRVKKKVREIETEDGVLIFDDSVEEKRYTDESELICWHWDHSIGRSVKGVNQLSLIYYSKEMTVPVGLEFVRKSEFKLDKKKNRMKRYSLKDKNEYFREMLSISKINQIIYKYVMTDSWYFNSENINFIKLKMEKDFIMGYKATVHLFLSKEDRAKCLNIDVEGLCDKECISVYINAVEFPLKLSKHILKDQNDKEVALYLITSDLTLDSENMLKLYKKRWKIEEFFKSMKSNCSYSKSPTGTVRTQINHFFCSVYSVYKLEVLKMRSGFNHFALKSKIYLAGLKRSFEELISIKKQENIFCAEWT